MRTVERGNTVFFKNIEFRDEEKIIVVASSATLSLSYPDDDSAESYQRAAVTLTQGADNKWSGSWDSSVSDLGHVLGTLTGIATNTEGNPITVVKDFKFRLSANRANEDANTNA